MQYKFSVDTSKIKKLLIPIYQVISTTTVLPILECFHIKFYQGAMFITGTDLDNTATLKCPVDTNEDFSFCVKAREFKHFIDRSLEPIANFTYMPNKLTIESGGFKVKMGVEDVSNYPLTPVLETEKVCTINSDIFVPHFKNALRFLSSDYLRPAMTGIYLHDNGTDLMVVSTDAHRLYFNSAIKTPNLLKGIKCIIGNKGSRILINQFKNVPVEISVSNTHIKFSTLENELIVRMVDVKYPNYEMVIQRHKLKFYLIRRQLKSFISIASAYVNKSTGQIKIQCDNESIQIVAEDIDYDIEATYKLPIYNATEKINNSFEFSVNINLLSEALKINEKDEYVVMEHSQTATKAMVIDDCLLLMPLMINN